MGFYSSDPEPGIGRDLWRLWSHERSHKSLTFGFHYLRSGFMLATIFFLGYLLWRRHVFVEPASQDPFIGRPSEEVR